MTDRHSRNPISLRFPEPDETWLRAYAKKTCQPVRRLILAAVAEYRDRHDPDQSATTQPAKESP